MTQYAIVQNGVVVNIAIGNTPLDATWIQSNAGIGYTYSGGVFSAPITPVVVAPPAQQVASALSAGLAITSTSTPAIGGTYPLDASTQFKISSIQLFIQTNGTFPGGVSAYPIFDVSGGAHMCPSIALFKEYSTAIANYISALDLYAAGVAGASLPSPTVTIA